MVTREQLEALAAKLNAIPPYSCVSLDKDEMVATQYLHNREDGKLEANPFVHGVPVEFETKPEIVSSQW